jgi:Tfp pilus assembly protein PilO
MKLSKTQRDQMIGVAVGAVALLALLWYFGVIAKQEELTKTEKNTAQMRDTLRGAESRIGQGEDIAGQLQARVQLLEKREGMLASNIDPYSWIISTINPFILPRKGVNMSHYSQPDISDVGIIADFPYKWATFHLEGSGYYHDFGKFFCDLENNFPYFRVQNLSVSANSTVAAASEPEKLNFVFELVVPIKASDTK